MDGEVSTRRRQSTEETLPLKPLVGKFPKPISLKLSIQNVILYCLDEEMGIDWANLLEVNVSWILDAITGKSD